jgi:hypothetical protein
VPSGRFLPRNKILAYLFKCSLSSIASLSPAEYFGTVALCSNSIGPLISSMNIRPSCTASTEFAISKGWRRSGLGALHFRPMIDRPSRRARLRI